MASSSSSQTPNLTPAENVLSRARAGLLEEGEPLVLYYLGRVAEADWSKWFESEVVAGLGKIINDQFILPCYLGDAKDKFPCVLFVSVVNGTKMVPNVGSIITCSGYEFFHNILVVKSYENHNIDREKCKMVIAKMAFANTKTSSPKADDEFLKKGTIRSILATSALNTIEISAYLHLTKTRLNLEHPQYTRCVLGDEEDSYIYFNVKLSALLGKCNGGLSPDCWVSPGLFLVSKFHRNAKFEIFLECRRVTTRKSFWAYKSSVSLDLTVSQSIERYVKELNVQRMYEKMRVKLQRNSSCVEIVSGVQGGDVISYTFTRGEDFLDGVYNVVIRRIASHSATTQHEHHHRLDTSELVGYTTVNLPYQRCFVEDLSNYIRRRAYSAMVQSSF